MRVRAHVRGFDCVCVRVDVCACDVVRVFSSSSSSKHTFSAAAAAFFVAAAAAAAATF